MARSRPGSITRRLLIACLATFPLLLVLTGIAIDRAHTNSLLKAEYDRMKLQFFSLLGAIEWQEGHLVMSERLRESRFTQFRSGLYGVIVSDKGKHLWRSLSSESLSLPVITVPTEAGKAITSETLIDGKPHFSYRYLAIWENDDGGETPLVFTLYSDKTSFLQELQQFRQQISLWLGLVLVVAVVLLGTILYWGLRPLRELARDLASLERGERLALGNAYPRELLGLTTNLNHLLEKEQKQRDRYRNTLADLAHSLKTPLAVLRSEELSAHERREQLQRMENIVAYQLQRAVGSGQHALASRVVLAVLVQRLCNSLAKVYRDASIGFEMRIPSALSVAMDEQDCMELLGNLLDNACKACRGQVRISARAADQSATVCIEDDGPGIDPAHREAILQRGGRGDQYSAGHGIGLAVVRDIVDSYSAGFEIEHSAELGGTRIKLTLPR